MNFKKNESNQKLQGSYYTPKWISDFVSRWVNEYEVYDILEPSCGDGIFFQSISDYTMVGSRRRILGFDVDNLAIQHAKERKLAPEVELNLFSLDFLKWSIDNYKLDDPQLFDFVVGNPPFIRYQYLEKDMQQSAQVLFELLGQKFTKHANAWIPFVLAAIAFLRPGGHIGIVIPSEILHVLYAQGIRDYLISTCSRILLVDPEDIWFENTLQGAMLLMAEKKIDNNTEAELSIVRTKGRSFADNNPRIFFETAEYLPSSFFTRKWTYALLSKQEADALKRVANSKNAFPFKEIAEVDVGIVTGANKYFLVTDDIVDEYGLSDVAYPMFGRSEHCRGIIYNQIQHEENAAKGYPTNFIYFDSEESGKKHQDYLKMGESQGIQTRYKCRIRKPWFKVPSVYSSKVNMLKRSNGMPRLILNEMGAFNTDTAYRITPNNAIKAESLVYCFINSITALSAELEGRFYGGGVLELVPSEIERLQMIYIEDDWDIQKLDVDVRNKEMHALLSQQDKIIFSKMQDVDMEDIELLHSALIRLQERRQRIEYISSDSDDE